MQQGMPGQPKHGKLLGFGHICCFIMLQIKVLMTGMHLLSATHSKHFRLCKSLSSNRVAWSSAYLGSICLLDWPCLSSAAQRLKQGSISCILGVFIKLEIDNSFSELHSTARARLLHLMSWHPSYYADKLLERLGHCLRASRWQQGSAKGDVTMHHRRLALPDCMFKTCLSCHDQYMMGAHLTEGRRCISAQQLS